LSVLIPVGEAKFFLQPYIGYILQVVSVAVFSAGVIGFYQGVDIFI